MNRRAVWNWSSWALLACLSIAATGCQTTIGGQTLPSANYLKDDVQFFPAGPEFLLPNKVQAQEQYQLDRQAIDQGFQENVP